MIPIYIQYIIIIVVSIILLQACLIVLKYTDVNTYSSELGINSYSSLCYYSTLFMVCNMCPFTFRENAVSPEVERDAHITQTYWMEIRHIIRCIYRENMSLTSEFWWTVCLDVLN